MPFICLCIPAVRFLWGAGGEVVLCGVGVVATSDDGGYDKSICQIC